jgi:CHAT domain-containing protein
MEPDGLVRSFLTLGAESVLASLWPLDDEGASRLMDAYYKGVSRGDAHLSALADARKRVREWREHPYYWASMTIFGGYGRKVSQ